MRIAISGFTGCGATTATRLVGKALHLTTANYTFHDLAEDLGLSFRDLQFDVVEKEFPKYDLVLDKKQVERAMQGDCVLGSRLAVWCDTPKMLKRLRVPKKNWFKFDLKVWLHASLKTRAQRVAGREGKPFSLALKETRARDETNAERYKKLYGINVEEYRKAVDLVINTENRSAEETAKKIIKAVEKKSLQEKRLTKGVDYCA